MQVQIFNKTKQANIINSLILEFEQDYNIIIVDGQNGEEKPTCKRRLLIL